MKKQILVYLSLVVFCFAGQGAYAAGSGKDWRDYVKTNGLTFDSRAEKKAAKKAWQLSLLEPAPEPIPEPTPEPAPEPAPEPDPILKSVNLSWQIPVLRADGSYLAISEISGFEIYYTAENSGDSALIAVDGNQVSNYKVGGLPADVYHFSMVTIDDQAMTSELSAIVVVDLR